MKSLPGYFQKALGMHMDKMFMKKIGYASNAFGEKNIASATRANPSEPMIPTGKGPSNILGFPAVAKTAAPAIPLIAACPMTAGQMLLPRRVNQPRKIPKPKVTQMKSSGPTQGYPG